MDGIDQRQDFTSFGYDLLLCKSLQLAYTTVLHAECREDALFPIAAVRDFLQAIDSRAISSAG